MKISNPFRTRRSLATVLLIGASGLYASGAQATVDCANPRKAVGTMGEAVYKSVVDATDLMTKQKYDDAINALNKVINAGSNYEKAVVNYNLGFAHSAKNDYSSAADAFAKSLEYNALPQQQQEQLKFNLGQLYMMADKPDDGIRTLQEYMAESCGTISADAHIFLANALAGRKRLKEALPQIDLALSKAKAPKETWMQLKLAVHYELKDYKSCAQTLVQLISMVPDKSDYWKQLSSMFYEMKKDNESLAVLAVAERQGFLNKPHEYRNLYSIYMMLELPYKAGTMLQAAVDAGQVPADETNLESIANAWINAREPDRAEKSLKTLASISERGEYFFKLGAMYGDEERWKESKEVLAKALQKGGIKRTGEAWMRLAVAEYNLKNEPATYDALRKALNYDESRKQAGEWLRHLTGQLAADDKAPATQDSAAVNRDSSVASSS